MSEADKRRLAAYSKVLKKTSSADAETSPKKNSNEDIRVDLSSRGSKAVASVAGKTLGTPSSQSTDAVSGSPRNGPGKQTKPLVAAWTPPRMTSGPSIDTEGPQLDTSRVNKEVEKALKAPVTEGHKNGFFKTDTKDSNVRKVAKFLVLVGKDEAARILKLLEPSQLEKVVAEIAAIRHITSDEAESLLKEFHALFSGGLRKMAQASGGLMTAREILVSAFGEEKGESLLYKAVPEARENPFGFLEDFEGDQINLVLKNEAPSTLALVLSRVSAKTAAAAMAVLDPKLRLETLRRIGHLDTVSPEILERVAEALREKARNVSRSKGETVDGKAALAEILKRSNPELGERLLQDIEDTDPALGQDLKQRLYTLDDVLKMQDKPLQDKLRNMDITRIIRLVRGKRPAFVQKILSNVSSNRRKLIEEENEIAGPLSKQDIQAETSDFMSWFRVERESGRIFLDDDEDVL